MISSGFNERYAGFPGVAPPQDYPYSETGFGTLPPPPVVRRSSEATDLQRSVYRAWTGTPW